MKKQIANLLLSFVGIVLVLGLWSALSAHVAQIQEHFATRSPDVICFAPLSALGINRSRA